MHARISQFFSLFISRLSSGTKTLLRGAQTQPPPLWWRMVRGLIAGSFSAGMLILATEAWSVGSLYHGGGLLLLGWAGVLGIAAGLTAAIADNYWKTSVGMLLTVQLLLSYLVCSW